MTAIQKHKIDLILLGDSSGEIQWPVGEMRKLSPDIFSLNQHIHKNISTSQAEAWLFWDSSLGNPPFELLQRLLNQPVDVWHAGLLLGMQGLPQTIDFVHPTWMLNRDPNSAIEATSWRLSLRACLVRTEVLRQMGGPCPEFKSIEAAALEMGHRWLSRGVLMRHMPELTQNSKLKIQKLKISFEDELRFIYYRFGKKWAAWTLIRAVLSGYTRLFGAFNAWRTVCGADGTVTLKPAPFLRRRAAISRSVSPPSASVSVLIPTLNRYSYLTTILDQLRRQTVKPLEIVIVDQTSIEERETNLAKNFSDLPIKILTMDQPGQCSSRNAGLKRVQGEYVLFLDDDDEIHPDLIEKHLRNLEDFQNDVSSGVAEEDGAGPLPENFKYLRASDVFPTNNTMIRREILKQSGLFDLTYDRKQRADADLGMRIYLSGAQMILNPEISVLHHHAPQGGLRTHKARMITRASSRKSLFQRHLPSDSEIYLAMRYFTSFQVREFCWLRILGTFSVKTKRMYGVKFIISLLLFPHTIWKTWECSAVATEMLESFPGVPELSELKKHG